MDTNSALDWLRAHQQLPENSPQEVVDQLDVVRKHLAKHPDPRCIPLMLGVFADHMGWGIFQLCDDVLVRYSQKELTPHLRDSLRSRNKGTRWWAAHWAMQFPSPELRAELEALLNNPEDEGAHQFAIFALAEIYRQSREPHILAVLRQRAAVDTDPERIELLRESLGEFDGAA